MNDMKHTKEPWAVGHVGDTIKKLVPISGRTSILTIAYEDDRPFAAVYKEEDARRIVACVNACSGISTELLDLPAFSLKEELDRVDSLIQKDEEREKDRMRMINVIDQFFNLMLTQNGLTYDNFAAILRKDRTSGKAHRPPISAFDRALVRLLYLHPLRLEPEDIVHKINDLFCGDITLEEINDIISGYPPFLVKYFREEVKP